MSSGFFKEAEVKNKGAGEVWDKEERDRALDEYFAGAHPKELGRKYKGAPKSFLNSILNKLRYNYKKAGKEAQPGRAERYEVVCRTSRKGKRFTENERDFWRCHQKLKLDPAITAKILCRGVVELTGGAAQEVAATKKATEVAPSLDLIWAYRYIYFVYKTPIVSNEAYDGLVKEEVDYGGGEKAFLKIKHHMGWPDRVKFLALYLMDIAKAAGGKAEETA